MDATRRSAPAPRAAHLMLLVASVLSLLAAASGCGDDSAPGCERDSDCRGARVCVEGQCVEGAASTNNATTTPNNGGSNNSSNNGSTNSSTATNGATVGPSCTSDLACPADQVCDQNACGERPCDGDADCGAASRFCAAGLCEPVVTCDDDAPCLARGGVCVDGQCRPSCAVAADCPDPQNQTCADRVCRDTCAQDSACDRGLICLDQVCLPPECVGTGTEGCASGERCQDGRCAPFTPCDANDDCAATEFCREGVCEPLTACVADTQCGDGEQCLDGFCYPITLCDAREACGDGLDCVGGRCVPFVCRGNLDCAQGEICDGGACSPRPEPAAADIDRIVILTPPQTINPEQSADLSAVALDADGEIIPGLSFVWESDQPDRVSVRGSTALGGDAPGVALITAAYDGLRSEPVAFNSLGAPVNAAGPRVWVTDAHTGAPVSGATVVYGDQQAATGDDGLAAFDLPDADPGAVTAFADGYNYVTVIAPPAGDLHLPVSAASGDAELGGFTGELDLSAIHTTGDINLGLAGASLDPQLVNLDLASVLGDPFRTLVSVPGLFEQELPLPGGLTLYGSVFGFNLDIKRDYFARSAGGFKVGWAFGGKIDAGEAFALVQGGDTANLIPLILGFFESFDHGLRPLSLDTFPRVQDSADIDGDGNTSELLPDYARFPDVALRPNTRQNLRVGAALGPLPDFPSGDSPFVILVGGTLADGIGFVPQGIGVSQDDDNDGAADPTLLRMAPAHSGLSVGPYAVAAITFDAASLGLSLDSGIDLPDDLSVQLWTGYDLPTDLDLSRPFLPLPQGDWDGPSRAFSADAPSDSALVRVTFTNADASWVVWMPASSAGFTLPAAPDGFADWSADSAVRMEAFTVQNGVTFSALVLAYTQQDLSDLNAVTEAFSRAIVSP